MTHLTSRAPAFCRCNAGHGLEVEVQALLPLGRGDVLDRVLIKGAAGEVHQDVDTTAGGLDALERGRHLRLLRQVRLDEAALYLPRPEQRRGSDAGFEGQRTPSGFDRPQAQISLLDCKGQCLG